MHNEIQTSVASGKCQSDKIITRASCIKCIIIKLIVCCSTHLTNRHHITKSKTDCYKFCYYFGTGERREQESRTGKHCPIARAR